MMTRQTVETTYADLRPTDLVIDKSGQAWPCNEVTFTHNSGWMTFWLLDPVTRIKMHEMRKVITDPVTVSRIPTQADEAAKLEADFDATKGRLRTSPEEEAELQQRFPRSDWAPAGTVNDSFFSTEEAVAAVEEIGGEVEAEVTAEEVDAANTATEEKPISLPPFTDMDILQMRSHLYLLHGVYAHDVKSRQETVAMHEQAHADHGTGKLNSCYIPHVHAEVK